MPSLEETAGRQHKAILAHVERLPELADLIVDGALADVRSRLGREYAYLTGRLLPHVLAIEAEIYPELDRLMSCCHSMLGMRREHRELERLIGSLGPFIADLADGRLDPADQTALRHALFRLHSIVKVHLAEEARLFRVLEHNVSVEVAQSLARSVQQPAGEPL